MIKNVFRDKGLFFKLFISFLFILVLVLSYGQLLLLLNDYNSSLVERYGVYNFISIYGEDLNYNESLETITTTKSVEIIEKQKYQCISPKMKWDNIFNMGTIPGFDFAMMRYQNKTFGDVNLNTYQKQTKINNPIIYGRDIEEDNEIIINETFAKNLGIILKENDISKIFNHQIYIEANSIIYGNDEEQTFELTPIVLANNLKIVGIYDDDMFNIITIYREQGKYLSPNLMIVSDNINIINSEIHYEVDLSNFNDSVNISEYIALYPEDIVTYEGEEGKEFFESVDNVRQFINQVLLLVGYIVILAMLINFFVVLENDYRSKRRLYGILNMLGMRKKSIVRMVLINISIIYFVTSVIAVLVTTYIMSITDKISVYIEDVEINILNQAIYVLLALSGCYLIICFFVFIILKQKLAKETITLMR